MNSPYGTEPIFDSYLAVALLVGALVALLFVGPGFGSLSRPRKLILVGLRAVVILLLLLCLIRPTWVHEVKTARRPVALLLFDVSRSMTLPSGIGSRSRWDIQRDALTTAQTAFGKLTDKMDFRVYSYDSTLHPIEQKNGKFEIPQTPLGEQTDIGTPLSEAFIPELGKRIAAVFMLGDGVQTAYDPQVESNEAGRRLRDDFEAPLIACAIGPSVDAAQAKDIAVERLDEQFTVFVKNELTVKALV